MKSTTFVLALAGFTSTVVAQNAAAILSDISTIDSDTKALTAAINANPFDLGAVVSAEQTLETAVKKGTTDATGVSATSSETSQVIDAVKGLISDIVASLNAAVFNSNLKPVASIVQMDLANLKSESDAFADALIADAPADAKSAGAAAKSCIDAAFASAAATKTASGACVSDINYTPSGNGGSGSSSASSGGPSATATPSGSASASASATDSSSGSTSTGEVSAPSEPTATVAPTVPGTSSPTGTGSYVPPPAFTGAAGKVGISGAAVFAALAYVL